MNMRHSLRKRIADRTIDGKGKKPKKPEQQNDHDDASERPLSPKFSADVYGIVFDDPVLQASWQKTLDEQRKLDKKV
jgi:hypothetical protein